MLLIARRLCLDPESRIRSFCIDLWNEALFKCQQKGTIKPKPPFTDPNTETHHLKTPYKKLKIIQPPISLPAL
jgi:hypothetical protein